LPSSQTMVSLEVMVERVRNLKSLEESAKTTCLYAGWISAFMVYSISERKGKRNMFLIGISI